MEGYGKALGQLQAGLERVLVFIRDRRRSMSLQPNVRARLVEWERELEALWSETVSLTRNSLYATPMVVGALLNKAGPALWGFARFAQEVLGDMGQLALDGAQQGAKLAVDGAKAAGDLALGGIRGIAERVLEGAKEGAKDGVEEGAKEGIKRASDGAREALGPVVRGKKEAEGAVPEPIPTADMPGQPEEAPEEGAVPGPQPLPDEALDDEFRREPEMGHARSYRGSMERIPRIEPRCPEEDPPPSGSDVIPGEASDQPVPIGGHRLPPLPYAYNALEPHIDEMTMRLHHLKHHQTYVNGLNRAERALAEARRTNDFSLVRHWERELAFHGAGHYLHTIFFPAMTPKGGGRPTGELLRLIERDFGSFDAFQRHFTKAAENVEGGGWAILVWAPRARRLEILTAEKHQNLSQQDVIPLLPLDVWEHAYYLTYDDNRPDYIKNWWCVVNWPFVAERLATARRVEWPAF
jgi:superoxide dismutase